MDFIKHLITNYWGLEKPNLLISVTGGAKNISMSKKLKDAFKKGLHKTAHTTGKKRVNLNCIIFTNRIEIFCRNRSDTGRFVFQYLFLQPMLYQSPLT